MDLVADARHIQFGQRLDRRFRLATGGAEGCEIVAADEMLRGFVHGVCIERDRQPPDPVVAERGRRTAAQDAIQVMPRGRREAGVEAFRRDCAVEHRDRLRLEVIVQRLAQLERLPFAHEVEVRHLPQGMHAGIGAARSAHADLLARELADCTFQLALDRDASGLELPADKRRAVVFDGDAVAGHARF